MKLSPEGNKRYQRETAVLLGKMLAIAAPIGLGGVTIIVYMVVSKNFGYWIAVLCVGVPVVLTAVFFCVLFAAHTYIRPLIYIDEFCSRLQKGEFTALEDLEGAGVMREVASTLDQMSAALGDFMIQAGDSTRKLAQSSDNHGIDFVMLEDAGAYFPDIQIIPNCILTFQGHNLFSETLIKAFDIAQSSRSSRFPTFPEKRFQ